MSSQTPTPLKPGDIIKLNDNAYDTLRYIQKGLTCQSFERAADKVFDLYAITLQYGRDYKEANAHLQARESTGAHQIIKQVVDECLKVLKWIRNELRERRAMAKDAGVSTISLGDRTQEYKLLEYIDDISMWIRHFEASLGRLGMKPLEKHEAISRASFIEVEALLTRRCPSSRPGKQPTLADLYREQRESIMGIFLRNGASKLHLANSTTLIEDFVRRLSAEAINTTHNEHHTEFRVPASRGHTGYNPIGDEDEKPVRNIPVNNKETPRSGHRHTSQTPHGYDPTGDVDEASAVKSQDPSGRNGMHSARPPRNADVPSAHHHETTYEYRDFVQIDENIQRANSIREQQRRSRHTEAGFKTRAPISNDARTTGTRSGSFSSSKGPGARQNHYQPQFPPNAPHAPEIDQTWSIPQMSSSSRTGTSTRTSYLSDRLHNTHLDASASQNRPGYDQLLDEEHARLKKAQRKIQEGNGDYYRGTVPWIAETRKYAANPSYDPMPGEDVFTRGNNRASGSSNASAYRR